MARMCKCTFSLLIVRLVQFAATFHNGILALLDDDGGVLFRTFLGDRVAILGLDRRLLGLDTLHFARGLSVTPVPAHFVAFFDVRHGTDVSF